MLASDVDERAAVQLDDGRARGSGGRGCLADVGGKGRGEPDPIQKCDDAVDRVASGKGFDPFPAGLRDLLAPALPRRGGSVCGSGSGRRPGPNGVGKDSGQHPVGVVRVGV